MDENNFVAEAEGLVEDTTQTIGDLIERAQRSSVTGASAYEITLPSGVKINVVSQNDPRLSNPAPQGTTIEAKSSAKAGQ